MNATMTTTNIRVKDIRQADDRTLAILWTDGKEHLYDVVSLRRQCPCAACVDELSGMRTLKPADVPESVRPVNITSVGRYALTIAFSDNHRTGIYTFKSLRDMAAAGSAVAH